MIMIPAPPMKRAMMAAAVMAREKEKQKSHEQRLSIYPWLRFGLSGNA
jgi:hypothetical protein